YLKESWVNSIFYSHKYFYAVSTDGTHYLLYYYGREGKRDISFDSEWPPSPTCDFDNDMIRNELEFLSIPTGFDYSENAPANNSFQRTLVRASLALGPHFGPLNSSVRPLN